MEGNSLIHQKACQYQWSGDCFLSVKSFYQGSANYQVRQREYILNDSRYLILNECTRYQLTIDTLTPTESFCVFFSPAFVVQSISEWMATEEQKLDRSIRTVDGLRLIERTYKHTGPLSCLLYQGRKKQIAHSSALEQEEFYHALLEAIIAQDTAARLEAGRLAGKKKATREEIYRRVQYARDFIDSRYTEDLSLKQIAQASLLSENHLLRNFRQVLGMSPFQYISRQKLYRARQLIVETDQRIGDIAIEAGYASLSNFSYYFKQTFGVSPTALRKKVICRK